jgi:hypothetical protein
MLIPALLTTALTACPQAPVQEQQLQTRALTTPKDMMLHGIIAGTTFQSNQGFTLQNGSSIHANTGLVLNSRNIVLNGGIVSSTNTANCSDNSGQGFCLNGKPKFVNPIVTVPKPDIAALKAKYTAVPVITIQGTLNLNSSSDITSRFDNKIVLVKGSVNLNAIAVIKNAVLIVEETLKSNKGITLENSRILTKGAEFNQSTVLNNSRIITNEDLSFNGKLESTGLSSVVSSKNLTTNQSVTSSTGELAVIANQNITTNQSSSGKLVVWAGGNITLNQSSSLEGSVVAGGKVTLNQGVTLTKVLQHGNGDVLGGGGVQLTRGPKYTGQVTKNQPFTTPDGLVMRAENPEQFGDIPAQAFGQRVLPEDIKYPKLGANVNFFRSEGWTDIVALYALGTVNVSSRDYIYELPLPAGLTINDIGVLGVSSVRGVTGQNFPPNLTREQSLIWDRIRSIKLNARGKIEFYMADGSPEGAFAIYRRRTPTRQNVVPQNNPVLRLQQAAFEVVCNIDNACNTTSMTRINMALDAAYTNLQAVMGIAPRFVQAFFSVDQSVSQENGRSFFCFEYEQNPITGEYFHTTDPPTPTGSWAYYFRDRQEIHYCGSATGTLSTWTSVEEINRGTRHEMFHAIQESLLNTAGSNLDNIPQGMENWIIEGTAVAAENSTATQMQLSPDFSRRLINVPLQYEETGSYSYQAQDFWVFTGKWLGTGLPYLKNIFKTGLKKPINDVNTGLIAAGFPNGLARAYYLWAKNQGFEKNNSNYGMFPFPCYASVSTLGNYGNFVTDINVTDQQNEQRSNPYKVEPLESRAVSVKFVNPQNKRRIYKLQVISSASGSGNFYDTWYSASPRKIPCNNNPGDILVTNVKNNTFYTAIVSSTKLLNRLDTEVVPPDDFFVKVTSITPAISVPSSITLSGNVGDTLTDTIKIANVGEVNSTLKYKSYFASVNEAVTPPPFEGSPLEVFNPSADSSPLAGATPLAGAVARVQNAPTILPYPEEGTLTPVGGNFLSPLTSSPDDKKLVVTDNEPTPSDTILVSFKCPEEAGTYEAKINVVYKTGATDDNGVEILENAVVNVEVTCIPKPKPKPKADLKLLEPEASSATALVGQTASNNLRISNTGEANSTLEWRIPALTKSPMSNPNSTPNIEPRASGGGSGSLPSGQVADVPVSFNCEETGIFVVYVNIIVKEYNLADELEEKLIVIALTFRCIGEPKILVTPNPLSLATTVNSSQILPLVIENTGTTRLTIFSATVTQGASWLSIEAVPNSLAAKESAAVNVTGTCGAVNEKLEGSIRFLSDATNSPTLIVGVSLDCVGVSVSGTSGVVYGPNQNWENIAPEGKFKLSNNSALFGLDYVLQLRAGSHPNVFLSAGAATGRLGAGVSKDIELTGVCPVASFDTAASAVIDVSQVGGGYLTSVNVTLYCYHKSVAAEYGLTDKCGAGSCFSGSARVKGPHPDYTHLIYGNYPGKLIGYGGQYLSLADASQQARDFIAANLVVPVLPEYEVCTADGAYCLIETWRSFRSRLP